MHVGLYIIIQLNILIKSYPLKVQKNKELFALTLTLLCIALSIAVFQMIGNAVPVAVMVYWSFSSSPRNTVCAPEHTYDLVVRKAHKHQRNSIQNQSSQNYIHHVYFYAPVWNATSEVDSFQVLIHQIRRSGFQNDQLRYI